MSSLILFEAPRVSSSSIQVLHLDIAKNLLTCHGGRLARSMAMLERWG